MKYWRSIWDKEIVIRKRIKFFDKIKFEISWEITAEMYSLWFLALSPLFLYWKLINLSVRWVFTLSLHLRYHCELLFYSFYLFLITKVYFDKFDLMKSKTLTVPARSLVSSENQELSSLSNDLQKETIVSSENNLEDTHFGKKIENENTASQDHFNGANEKIFLALDDLRKPSG